MLGASAFGQSWYKYDLVGNPVSVTLGHLYDPETPVSEAVAWCYSYDGLNRLKTVTTGGTTQASLAQAQSCATPVTGTAALSLA